MTKLTAAKIAELFLNLAENDEVLGELVQDPEAASEITRIFREELPELDKPQVDDIKDPTTQQAFRDLEHWGSDTCHFPWEAFEAILKAAIDKEAEPGYENAWKALQVAIPIKDGDWNAIELVKLMHTMEVQYEIGAPGELIKAYALSEDGEGRKSLKQRFKDLTS